MTRSTKTVAARVVGSQYRVDGEQYSHGDTVDVPEWALDKHPNTLERVDDADGDADGGGDGETSDDGGADIELIPEDELDPHPSELTVDELDDRVSDVDDVTLLISLEEAERANKDRSGALAAIESRVEAVESAEED